MYFKFTEKAPDDGRKIKYEAVIIEASSLKEAFHILQDEFKDEELHPEAFRVEETRDLFQGKPLIESVKSFIIIHSANKIREKEI